MKVGKDYIGICTVFFCHDGDGNFVMHKRSENCRDEVGSWSPGAGKLEQGLTLEENVLKEISEEYDCTGSIEMQLPTYEIIKNSSHWIGVPFLVSVDRDEVSNGEPHKIEDLDWFTFDALPDPLHSGFKFILENFREDFKPYL